MYNNIKFIKKANEVHNNFYDYSLVDYKNSDIKVKIICPIHGIFEQKPVKHLNGQGCPGCGGSVKKSLNFFIKKANEVHNNFYDYSLVDYKNIKTDIKIICPIHGIFKQRPDHHLNGHGCIKCMADKSKLALKEFIEKSNIIHHNKYDYSSVVYKGYFKKVDIICPIHGSFKQRPSNHIQGQGCPKCKYENMKLTKKDFIDRSNIIHEFFYDYSLVDYVNNYTKVRILCPKHGEFEQKPNNHLQGQGCPSCKKSFMENKINSYLKKFHVVVVRQKIFSDCKNIMPLPFDFYLPEYNLCIEYNGKQHYESIKWFGGDDTLKYIIKNDEIKKNYCLDNNIKYLEISYKNDNDMEEILNGILF